MQPAEIFARGVWKLIPSQDDVSWVHLAAASERTNKPMGDYGVVVKEMIEKGVSVETIARFAKLVGYQTAFGICYYLEDPYVSYEDFPGAEEVVWGLFRIDPNTEEPIEPLTGIHEVILGMDPSGSEMRPESA